jgi:16S rRNA (uracil1498-N3)-methyltransferase
MTTRLYVELPLAVGARLELPAAAAHHAAKVLRLRAGEPVVLFNGEGGEYAGRLAAVSARAASVELTAYAEPARESPLELVLAQGISRGERMDYTLQKAVELGVAAIVPLHTRRCTVQLGDERAAKRLEHWRGVIVHACEQSGRTRVPRLEPVATLEDFAAAGPHGTGFCLAPEAAHSLAAAALSSSAATLVAGPEGGLDAEEIARLAAAGFTAVRLGPRILRTETAALVALAVLQARAGDLA